MNKAQYKPYLKYKPSGVGWIGEIPEGWEVRKLKWIVASRLKYGANETAELDDPKLPRYIRITDFDDDGNIREETFKSLPNEKAKGYLLSEGDILFARSGATVGKTFQFKNYRGVACFAGYLIKATPKASLANSDFLYYFTKSNSYESWKNAIFIQATIQNIGADKYQVLQIPFPPFPQQQAIADFLDRETARINSIVEKQTRMIELLKEKRSALITQAVTKGLDPNAMRKPSGAEWIGGIPMEWEVRRLRFSVKYNVETLSENTTDPNYEIKYLDISNVDGDGNIISTETLLFRNAPSRARRVVKNSNTIISTVRTYLKAIAYLDEIPSNLIVSTGFAVIESVELTNSKYLFYFLRSEYFVQNVTKNSKGVSYPAITPSQSPANLIDILILVPPLPQQQAIADFLDRETAKIDTLISKIEKQIELLDEYKQSLITYAVTGKIDVRGEAYAQNP